MSDEIRRLLERWREKADANERTPSRHPRMAEDLKLGASIWAAARRECADELEDLLPACARQVMQSADDSAAYLSVPCDCGKCPARSKA